MGISITATNSKYDFYMGYGGFFSLRKNIALALDKEFGENYARLGECHTSDQYDENGKISTEIISRKHLDDRYSDVLDFLYMPDVEGKASYKVCRQILELIKDVNFEDKGFRYGAYSKNDYEDFKCFLKECISHKRNMRWS